MQQGTMKFIQTKASDEVEELLKRQNLVIVTGHSGSGKSAIIQHIAKKNGKEGWVVKQIKTVEEIMNAVSLQEKNRNKFLFIFEDPIGKYSFDEKALESWTKNEEELRMCFLKAKVLISCRKYILKNKSVKGLLMDCSHIVDITDAQNKLQTGEKQNIFKAYAPNDISYNHVLSEIVKVETCFPLLCNLCFTNNKNPQDVLHFFNEPVAVFKKEITNFRNSCPAEYCALILLVLFNNDFCTLKIENMDMEKFERALNLCGMKNTAPYIFVDILETLDGFFVQQKGRTYKFYNFFVRDITTYIFGSDYPADVIECADIDFLRRRANLKCCSDQNDELTLLIDDSLIDDLGKRLSAEILKKGLLDVIFNPCLKSEKMVKVLIKELKHHPEELLKKIELQSVKRELFEAPYCSLLSKVSFIELENQISPICAIIVFCQTSFSLELLKALKQNLNTFKSNSVFSAVCCNGGLDLFNVFSIEDIKNSLMENWGNLYPIHILTMFHNFEILQKLIQLLGKDVNLNAKSRDGLTPLILATGNDTDEFKNINEEKSNESRRDKTIKILVNHGANINLCTMNGVSPLQTACRKGFHKTVEILIRKGADVKHCDMSESSPLFIACQYGHDKTIELLMEKGADKNKCNEKGDSPLHKASQNGYYRIVKLLLNRGADIDKCNKDELTPLHKACQNGHHDIVKLLLKSKANINLRSKNGNTSLSLACEEGHNETVNHLLFFEADINMQNDNKASPLFLACENGHSDTVKILLDNGANINLCDENEASPLYIACEKGYYRTVEILFEKKYGTSTIANSTDAGTISTDEKEKASLLFKACEKGHEMIAKFLLDKGARKINGKSPLHIACENGRDNIVQLLLDNNEEIDFRNHNGATPLILACQNKHKSTAKLLLSRRAKVNLCDKNHKSPLFIACQNDNDTIIDLLLSYKANVQLCDENGTSPLYVACQFGGDGAVQLLLREGADVNLCSFNKTSPLCIACENGHDSIVQHLLERDACIDLSNTSGANPLFVASQNGHYRIVEYLLYKGADCNSRNKKGESPLFIACQNGHNVIVQFLISYGADCTSCDENGISPLNTAGQNGHIIVEEILTNISKGVNNLCVKNETYPFFRACQNGYMQVVQSLLSRGADIDINLCLSNGATPLFIACLNGHDTIVQLLFDKSAEINIDNSDNTVKFLLCEDTVFDNMHEPDSFFSLFLFCKAELMLRMNHEHDCF